MDELLTPILEARGIRKEFPGVVALDGADLAVLPGEVHCLVGQNGAGKSTLVKIIMGAYSPDAGQLLMNGREVSFKSPRDSLNAGIRTVIDIGGQDSKIIRLDENGLVTDFIMNDKCAAGTGRFMEVMARILGTEVGQFDALAAHAEPAAISSMCTVFAESEVVSLLARGVPRESIARGVLDSIASRAAALLGRLPAEGAIAFTGGLSHSSVLRTLMEERIGEPLFISPASQLAGALGGAVIGWGGNAGAHGDN